MCKSSNEEKLKRYAVLQRWEFFGEWPHKQYNTSWKDIKFDIRNKNLDISILYVVGFNVFNGPDGTKENFNLQYTLLDRNNHMIIGRNIVCAPGQTIESEIVTTSMATAKQKDIGILLVSKEELDLSFILQEYRSLVGRFVSFITLSLCDLATPITDIAAFEFLTGAYYMINDAEYRIAHQHSFTDNDISKAIIEFASFESTSTDEKKLRLAAASRRFLSSLAEIDKIHQFCNLWEACEFLLTTKRQNRVGGGMVGKLSERIAQITGANEAKLRKIVTSIFVMRCNVVHNAFDQVESLHMLDDLEIICECVLRDSFGLAQYRPRIQILLDRHNII